MRYLCCDARRLRAVKEAAVLNGMEYVEVSDSDAPTLELRQRSLFVRFLSTPPALTPMNFVIDGGDRIPTVEIEWVAPATALPPGEDLALVAAIEDPSTVLVLRTTSRGDFSHYTLRLVSGPGSEEPPAGFDPLLTTVEFSFKVECPGDFDCRHDCKCHPPPDEPVAIDYLAKDFASFRGLMLDRLSVLVPEWRERTAADVGIALVELLAYVGDELSYRQDAVATEASFGTARLRTSLRRHVRLVDYLVNEGSNARVWARVIVGAEDVPVPAGTQLLTRVPDTPAILIPGSPEHRAALAAETDVFETVDTAVVHQSHERFEFWTWGDAGCCLPKGATSATLRGDHPNLLPGDVLVLTEVAGPETGLRQDADPTHRVAVRLTKVVSSADPSGGLFLDPPSNDPVPVTEITWDEEDALPFPLCISVEERPGLVVSEAWGNIVLADHGRTVAGEDLGTVPGPVLSFADRPGCDPCDEVERTPVPARFRPRLAHRPLTHRGPAQSPVVAEGPLSPQLSASLATLDFTELEGWLRERGFVFLAGAATLRGGDGVWTASDGETVVLLEADAGALRARRRPLSARETIAHGDGWSRPAVELVGTDATGTEAWQPQPDLLSSDGRKPHFVVEVEDDGSAFLRFGDDAHGRRAQPGTSFAATYRIGNGTVGNVGANSLGHVVTSDADVVSVTNPLPAAGGADPEPAEAIRRDAPEAFLVQERAVTAEDYARMTERSPLVQRAQATFRWTGSWHTVFVTADRKAGGAIDEAFERRIRAHLERYRMAGYDLEVDAPRPVSLDVELLVCAEPEHFRADVEADVLDVLSSGERSDGSLGLFHPDRFTFGQPVYLSEIVAAAQGIEGVQSVTPIRFQRQRDDASSGLATGVLTMDRLEIARLENDPSFPERGVLTIRMGGGK